MEIKKLSAFYGKKEILSDLDLTLERGRFTALLGKNGCGKSTLLGCINGQVRYTGSILLDGRPLSALPPRERAKRVALLPQFLPASPLKAEELVALGRTPYLPLGGRLCEADREAVRAAMEQCGVSALRERTVATLSGGERQRIYLAMLLAQDAEILLLDEPTAHMDMGYTGEFLSLLRKLTEEKGKTVLAVLHDLNDAVTYPHRRLLLHQGRLVDPERIEEIFGVRKICYNESEYFYK